MSTALAKRLETLEAIAQAEAPRPMLIILNTIVVPGGLGLPLVRVTTTDRCERAEFRPRADEDEAAFLRRVREVELPALNPDRKGWSLLGWSDEEDDRAES